ncbi:hypothetical protein [Dyella flagellata]|uniref:Uncharacterized protein n=1 Tax=Dyella flagellata TaxID=1867833 RepID=A0ABQ5X872_9GAMM|nr:hypothetical protein [Dyella flagellata]GLQ86871.1 hypothetical protein GCM10007898_04370 [Dyella flagellata]
MNFETLLLRGLFGTCVLACGLMLLAMVTARPASALVTPAHSIAAATAIVSASHAGKAG